MINTAADAAANYNKRIFIESVVLEFILEKLLKWRRTSNGMCRCRLMRKEERDTAKIYIYISDYIGHELLY